jgi:tripartite-type tricarboxylate transporter receptor subunit TctC
MFVRAQSLFTFVLALACANVFAQPRTPAKMLVGFPPGGAVDVLGRLFAEKISEETGRPMIVENRPGAAGQIAAEALKAAAPDGNTLMVAPDATIVFRPQTLKQPPFDALADFAPVAHVGTVTYALGVNADLPVKDLREFASWAKANPARASFASAGAGGSTHFYGLLIARALGIELRQIPYKGSGPAVVDLVAGHVPSAVQPLGTMLAQARSGKIRLLAASSPRRSSAVPELPTFAELGYPSLTTEGWFAVFAPKATPEDTIVHVNALLMRSMRAPDVREKMRALDLEPREMSAVEFAALVKADYERWGPVIRASGFSGDAP